MFSKWILKYFFAGMLALTAFSGCEPENTNQDCRSIDDIMQRLYDEGIDYLIEPTKENCAVYKELMLIFLTKCFRNNSPIVQDSFDQSVAEIEAIDCSKVGEGGLPEL
jgi:hypothetical protein